jgi:leucyl aminopeptidase
MSKSIKLIIISILFISTAFFAFYYGLPSNAEKHFNWITVDQKELVEIQQLAESQNQKLDIEIINQRNGIAVVRGNDLQFERISGLMHEKFHKCSGFIAHESEADALNSIDSLFAVDPNQQFVDYTIDNQANVNPMLTEAVEPNVRQTIIDLSAFPNRRHNLQGGSDGANWIKNKWTQLAGGRSDVTVEFYNHPTATTPQPSVIMTIQGTTFPGEIVVLGGHQDSINTGGQTLAAPGADDDASGIASLTETIRVLMIKNFRPKRTVKFMAYAAEEVGLRGSAGIAADFRSRNENVIGVIQLDMTNYKGTANADIVIFTDFTNAAQNTFIQNLITTYQPTLAIGTSSCGYGCSDHASWHNRNYPASMPAEATFADTNNALHTVNDTIARSNNNANHALKFTKLALSFVGELAKGTLVSTRKTRADFDGDGKSDHSVFRPDLGNWYLNRSSAGFSAYNFGISTDLITPNDFDGDNKTDLAVFRNGVWFVLNSANSTVTVANFGTTGDNPVANDFDGDNKADFAVFRSTNGVWYRLNSSNGSFSAFQFGANGDLPIKGDFDGDNKADFTVYRNGLWYISKSGTNNTAFDVLQFGTDTDNPVPADYDGDGKDDVAVWRPTDRIWYIQKSSGGFSFTQFGNSTDIPTPADYDGDGKADISIFRNGLWYQLNSTNGGLVVTNFGLSSDKPIPNSYLP